MEPVRTSLNYCLDKYKDIIEVNQKLGKKYGNYLVYQADTGWDLRSLNFFQQILRNWFGFYKETHWTTLKGRIQEFDQEEDAIQVDYLRNRMSGFALMAVGFKGRLDGEGVNTQQAYEEVDAALKEEAEQYFKDTGKKKNPFLKITPEYEGHIDFRPIRFSTSTDNLTDVTEKVKKIYKELVVDTKKIAAGPFGDCISLIKLEPKQYVITQIAFKAFPKPGTATDLIPIFKSKGPNGEDQYFALTIIRDKEPGENMDATIGGFTGIELKNPTQPPSQENPYVLDSEFYTALKEAKEESGLRIWVDNIEDYREDDNVEEVMGNVSCGNEEFEARIIKLRTIRTADCELIENNYARRVYKTTGFACIVDLGEKVVDLADKVNSEFLKKFKLEPDKGEDAKGLHVHNMTAAVESGTPEALGELEKRLKFGIPHQNKFIELTIQVVRKHFGLDEIKEDPLNQEEEVNKY